MKTSLRQALTSSVSLLAVAALSSGCGSASSVAETGDSAPAATTTVEVATTLAPSSTASPPTSAQPTTTIEPTTAAAPTTTVAAATSTTTSPLYLVDVYDPNRDPFADMEDARSRASLEGKHFIAIVGGDWCPDCLNFDAFVKERPALSAAMHEQFILVKMNLSEENENQEWLDQFPELEWVPHFFIFDGAGLLAESYDTRALMTDGLFDEAKLEAFVADWS